MMALVPSTNVNKNSNANNDKIHEEFRTIKTYVINQGHENQSDISFATDMMSQSEAMLNTTSTLSFNQMNREYSEHDDTMSEQIYQFQQSRNGVSISTSRQRHSGGIPIISIGDSFNNRKRLSAQENLGIQLPLIETHVPRPVSRTSTSKKTTEPLGALPLKRRRNPLNFPLPLPSDDKRNLNSTPSLRTRMSSRESDYYEPSSSSITEPPKLSNNRIPKGTLSRQLPTQNLNSNPTKTFRLIIHDGITKDETEDFIQFRQFYYSMWDDIVNILYLLEKLMFHYFVPIALINGEKVAELAQNVGNQRKPTLEELLCTIINRDEVEKLIKQPGRRFLNNNGKDRAAIIIQSYWRGYHTRRIHKQRKAARIIASCWLRYSKLSKIRQELKLIRQRQLDFFQKTQNELRDNWMYISTHRRILVHLPSLGLTERIRRKLKNLSIRENYQIGRLCELEDPNIDVIYVSSMPVNDEILQYYNKLINLRASVEQGNEQPLLNNANERFIIIVPEAVNRFPKKNLCLSSLLKYSPKALKQIKNLIKDRQAYLVPGISHIDDLYVSEYLDIPIYGCEPEISYLYSTKSGSKRIFKSSNVPVPFGEYDIYNEKHLFESLAQLILEHPDVQRWIFKIDDYFDGLGIAYCDIAMYLPCYKDLSRESAQVKKEFCTKILSELPDVLDKYTIYVHKNQFKSWKSYLKVFLSQGGVIEAYPPTDSITSVTLSLSIEPDGNYSIICSGDQLHAESQFSCWGLIFPQSSINVHQLNNYCSLIVEQCRHRSIYGYIDIDFLSFIDTKTDKQQIWVTDLSIGYSEHIALFRAMRYITTGQFNPQTNTFIVKMKQPKQRLRNWQNGAPEYIISEKTLYAIWSTKLNHKNLSNLHYSIFFQICRSHGVGFDIRAKQGSIFTLFECDHHENIGMITVSETLQSTLTNFISYLTSIYQEITTAETEGKSNFLLAVNDIENILGITQENASNVSLNTTTS